MVVRQAAANEWLACTEVGSGPQRMLIVGLQLSEQRQRYGFGAGLLNDSY